VRKYSEINPAVKKRFSEKKPTLNFQPILLINQERNENNSGITAKQDQQLLHACRADFAYPPAGYGPD